MIFNRFILGFCVLTISSVTMGEDLFVQSGDQIIDAALMHDNYKALNFGSKPAKVRLWPDGVLPIEFTSEVPQTLRNTFALACAEWSRAARVKCVKGAYKGQVLTVSTSYLGFAGGCWSMLGSDYYFMGMRRRMNLSKGCEEFRTVLHEIGHAFGLTHEHQRTDRDKYVKILTQNIDGKFLNFGLKLNFGVQAGDNLTPYDFLSIMHYGPKAFSRNGKPTILPLPEYSHLLAHMGSGHGLSEGDVISIQALYGAP